MKKKLKLNNKGFVLAETLIVAVAISLIFAIVFRNFYPLMGEYERRENYDDIDSKYGTYWIKKIIQSCDTEIPDLNSDINIYGGKKFDCSYVTDETNRQICLEMINKLEVSCDNPYTTDRIETCAANPTLAHIFITKFNLKRKDPSTGVVLDYKTKFIDSLESVKLTDFADYVRYLPDYSKVNSLNRAEYRVMIEYYRHRFDTPEISAGELEIRHRFDTPEISTGELEIDTQNDYKTYATIEVKRNCSTGESSTGLREM